MIVTSYDKRRMIMNLVNYEAILTNCGARTTFDTYGFDRLLRRYIFDWKDIILKRHHPFVEYYIKHKGNMSKVSKSVGYSIVDLRAIFLRIQSQFELYEEDENSVFVDMVLNIYGLPIITRELEYEEYISKNKKKLTLETVFDDMELDETDIDESNECDEFVDDLQVTFDDTYYNQDIISDKDDSDFLDIGTVLQNIESYLESNPTVKRSDKLKKYGEEFKKLKDISIVAKCLSARVYKTLVMLTEDKTIDEISLQLNSSKSYLICCILGRNNPRSKTEHGIIELIKSKL